MSSTSIIEFDVILFRDQFPNQFPDPPYTNDLIETYWNIATCYISDENCGFLTGECRRVAINLMTAHLLALNIQSNIDGENVIPQQAFIESATISKITVSLQKFETKSQFSWWLNQTPYGQQLSSLLNASLVGGFYYGGYNELGSFRRSGGNFIPTS